MNFSYNFNKTLKLDDKNPKIQINEVIVWQRSKRKKVEEADFYFCF